MGRLNYSTSGSGKNIVLIHGWGVPSCVWQTIARSLTQEFRVTLFDLPGYGNNLAWRDQHGLASISEKIYSVIPKPSIILGWSMGGLIAMWLAINYPQTTAKLILTNSTPCFIEKNFWPGIAANVLSAFQEGLIKNFEQTMLRFISLQINTKNAQDARKQLQFLRKIIYVKENYSEAILHDGLNILLNTDLRLELPKIQAPILWLLGENDRLVPAAVNQHLAAYLPQTQIKVLRTAAHIPFISHSDHFIQIITKFIYDQSV